MIAKELGLPLEIVLSKKIGHPYQKEYAVGAVSMESRVLSDTGDVSQGYIEKATERIRSLLRETYQKYHKSRKPISLVDKIVILVDDGVATGSTVLSTVELIKVQNPKQIILAVPIIASHTLQVLKKSPFIDEIIWVSSPSNFSSVSQFYHDFEQISEETVISLLKKKLRNEA